MATGFTGLLKAAISHCSDITRAIAAASMLVLGSSAIGADVTVVGLFPGKAVVVINGAPPRTISVGQKQPEAVTLLSTGSSSAVFDIEGTRHTLELGEHFALPSAGNSGNANDTLTLSADTVGQFWTIGQVNGKSVRFLIDTGATSIALPASAARAMGIEYTKGQRGVAATAGGAVPAWRVSLDTVSIGTITLYGIEASVLESGLDVALLGMSFLNRVAMKRDGAQMTLTKRY